MDFEILKQCNLRKHISAVGWSWSKDNCLCSLFVHTFLFFK